MKVKPRKINPEVFCIKCNKKVKFRIEEEGCASVTPKGVMFYNELYAHCPHCYREVYVAALNDINARSRQKAFEELPEITREEAQVGIDKLIEMFEEKENENNKTTMS